MIERRGEKLITAYTPFPMCVVNSAGKVTRANSKIDEVFVYHAITDADIFALTGIKHKDLILAAKGEKNLIIERKDKHFKIMVSPLGERDNANLALFFLDITAQMAVKKLYNEQKNCMAIINVDNYDELAKKTNEAGKIYVISEVDRILRAWAAKLNASVIRYKNDRYFYIMESSFCEKLIEGKFAILDDIRKIETGVDFPVTLSIGIGRNGKNPAETEQYALDALDLAFGRGGDQAVIKNIGKLEYYGGKTQSVEKSNKSKSRIVAHALSQLIEQASNIIIMGHRLPDMDSFGAALGMARMVYTQGKSAHIVINTINESLVDIYKVAREEGDYSFINSERAISMANEETLVIVVDTHRPSYCDCPEILEIAESVAIIDHHRRVADIIENPKLSYIEAYASSASELVAEMLQYAGEKKSVLKIEVEALLAGIMVDTNQFSVKAGVRTFEAAAWLRRSGADTTTVKKYFKSDKEVFLMRAKCVSEAKFIGERIAYSILEGENPNAQILNSQAADMLLGIKGVEASFVIGTTETGKTVISSRSLGEINVQLIMEKFGGGGHLNTAGAQTDMSIEEALEMLKEMLGEQVEQEEK